MDTMVERKMVEFMEAQTPMWKLVLDMMTQMNDHIQGINLAGIFLSFGLLFVFLFVVSVYAKLDDRISKLEEKGDANTQS